mmetsp:Transcript_26624/g.48240  ORF Transcript_26624/g.48240 Transcript_26624/m.48240 type:complete len:101 (-) Transcript_26624:158-460(-)
MSALGPERRALHEKWCGGCRYNIWSCDQRVKFLENSYGNDAIESELDLLEGGHCGAEEGKDVEADVAAENATEVLHVVENGVKMEVAMEDGAGAGSGTGV